MENVANKQAMHVQNVKHSLDELKFIIAAADKKLESLEAAQRAGVLAVIYSAIYVALKATDPNILTLVSIVAAVGIVAELCLQKYNDKYNAELEFTEKMDYRFTRVCDSLVTKWTLAKAALASVYTMKKTSPYRFLLYGLSSLTCTAYIGTILSIPTLMWTALMIDCSLLVPQVNEQVNETVSSFLGKKVQKTS